MTLSVERYRSALASDWNEFVHASRNGTFLLDRGYMDYHADRFVDHSLVVRDDSGNLQALVPANETTGAIYSHAGLTYGGMVLPRRTGTVATLESLEAIRRYMAQQDLTMLHYKTIPWIYHRHPAEDDRYALFRLGARLVRRDTLSVVPRGSGLDYQKRRSRGVRAAMKASVEVTESSDYAVFWELLEENLRARHGVDPVHTLQEILLLRERFPSCIRLFLAVHDSLPVAGVVVYETGQVAHAQYISANGHGRRLHALDLLFHHLLTETFPGKPYFDFGISTESGGEVLNAGLVEQKEGFGARCVVHDHYELSA